MVHMPYWQRKAFPGLFIQSTIDHQTEVVNALQADLNGKDSIINQALEEMSEGHQAKAQSKGSKQRQRPPAGVANGWMERAAIFFKLLKDEDFDKAKETAEYLEFAFPAMKLALCRMNRKS